jgi:hypothetical protein
MLTPERVREGFRRLAVVAGVVAFLLELGGWVNNTNKAGMGSDLSLPFLWVIPSVVSVVSGLAVWAGIRAIGWIVAGFFTDRPPGP